MVLQAHPDLVIIRHARRLYFDLLLFMFGGELLSESLCERKRARDERI